MIKAKYDVNILDNKESIPPLMLASQIGNEEIVFMLLAAEAEAKNTVVEY